MLLHIGQRRANDSGGVDIAKVILDFELERSKAQHVPRAEKHFGTGLMCGTESYFVQKCAVCRAPICFEINYYFFKICTHKPLMKK
mgnify:CR=1 FL=1